MEMEDSFGVIIRAKGAAAIAEGEKATLYHLAREKKNTAKSSLTKLKIKEKVAWECFDSCNDGSSTDVNPHRAGSQDDRSSADANPHGAQSQSAGSSTYANPHRAGSQDDGFSTDANPHRARSQSAGSSTDANPHLYQW